MIINCWLIDSSLPGLQINYSLGHDDCTVPGRQTRWISLYFCILLFTRWLIRYYSLRQVLFSWVKFSKTMLIKDMYWCLNLHFLNSQLASHCFTILNLVFQTIIDCSLILSIASLSSLVIHFSALCSPSFDAYV